MSRGRRHDAFAPNTIRISPQLAEAVDEDDYPERLEGLASSRQVPRQPVPDREASHRSRSTTFTLPGDAVRLRLSTVGLDTISTLAWRGREAQSSACSSRTASSSRRSSRSRGRPASLESLEYGGEALAVFEVGRKNDVHVSRGALVAVSGDRIAADDNEVDIAIDKRDEEFSLANRLRCHRLRREPDRSSAASMLSRSAPSRRSPGVVARKRRFASSSLTRSSFEND